MANRRRVRTARTNAGRRVNSNSSRAAKVYRINTYEDGNTVRYLEEEDEEDFELRPHPRRHVSERTKANRLRARNMSVGYVLFLTAVCVITVFLCIHYLQLRETYTNQAETIAVMETRLSRLQADNDAYEKQTEASVDLEAIRKTALNRLGMHYATESQIRYYSAEENSYVRQYGTVTN